MPDGTPYNPPPGEGMGSTKKCKSFSYFTSLCLAACWVDNFMWALRSDSDCFDFARALLKDSVQSQHSNFPSICGSLKIKR